MLKKHKNRYRKVPIFFVSLLEILKFNPNKNIMSKTIDELVEKVHFLDNGLKTNKERVKGLDIDFSTLDKMLEDCAKLKELGEKADDLRAKLKVITTETNQVMDGVKTEFQAIKKVIKTNFDQENWMKLGVQDKR